jgi:hypothetical protein
MHAAWGRDENRHKRTEKNHISTSVFIFFLVETGAGSKMESEYADIRKQTNTDGELKN